MAIRIITDSACDLPEKIVEELNIDVMPIYVYVNEKEYLDNVTIKPNELFKMMVEGNKVKTAQIPIHDFIVKFEECAKTDDTFICLSFSSKLSGTYQSAIMAESQVKENNPNLDVTIVDTKCVTMGLGLIVKKAAEMVIEGKSKEEILEMVDFYSKHMHHVFTVGTLEYLYRGGRISKTSASLGNILNIYPIITVEDGALVSSDKAKGSKKLNRKMIKYVDKNSDQLDKQEVGIVFGTNVEIVEFFRNEYINTFKATKIVEREMGCAISAHTGPDVIALFFLDKYKEF